jgi:hypothetical protein
MNEDQKKAIRAAVLEQPGDSKIQLEWCLESQTEYTRQINRVMAKFRLADYMGDEETMKACHDNMGDLKAGLRFIQSEIVRLGEDVKSREPLPPMEPLPLVNRIES